MKIIKSIMKNKEFLKLKKIRENNSRHLNQYVFDHSIAVMKAMQKSLSSFKNQKWLKQKIGKYSRGDLLIISSLLHDNAKSRIFREYKDRTTRSPSHELLGAYLFDKYLKGSDFSKKDLDFIKHIIYYHGFAFDAIREAILHPKNRKMILKKFYQITKPYSKELVLMMMADSTGSDFKRMNPAGFKEEIEFCRRLIKNI